MTSSHGKGFPMTRRLTALGLAAMIACATVSCSKKESAEEEADEAKKEATALPTESRDLSQVGESDYPETKPPQPPAILRSGSSGNRSYIPPFEREVRSTIDTDRTSEDSTPSPLEPKQLADIALRAALSRHPDLSEGDLVLANVDCRERDPKKPDAPVHASVLFYVKGSERQETSGELFVSHVDSIRVAMNDQGAIARWSGAVNRRTLSLAGTSARPDHSGGGRMVSLRFRDCPLQQVLDFYGELTGMEIEPYKGPRVEISARGETRLSQDQALTLLDMILRDRGVSLVEQDDGTLKAVNANQ